MLPPSNFYWFRIDNKHMTEPWLDQALMDSEYRSGWESGMEGHFKSHLIHLMMFFVFCIVLQVVLSQKMKNVSNFNTWIRSKLINIKRYPWSTRVKPDMYGTIISLKNRFNHIYRNWVFATNSYFLMLIVLKIANLMS